MANSYYFYVAGKISALIVLESEDARFLEAFHECALDKLSHEDHLRIAWLLLESHEIKESLEMISEGLRRFAISKGSESSYNQTMTCFWMSLVHHCLDSSSRELTFGEFLAENPILLQKSSIFKHWSKETILASEAKKFCIDPDLLPVPFLESIP